MSRGLSPTLFLFKGGNMVADKNNATCSICGRDYHKCLSCSDAMQLRPWQMFTDSASCYQVFQVVKGYSNGVYTKEEFKSKLKNIDLSDLENYREHIKTLIKDVLKEDKIVESVEKSTPVSRKRNYKANKIEVNENNENVENTTVETVEEIE